MTKRKKFFISHLVVSLCIALLAMSIIFYVWYPSPLSDAVGVTHIFYIMIAIDVIIGPVLGFIVYKEGKKTLKFDLAVIVLLQICAFLYGFNSIFQGRPVYIVDTGNYFELVRNNDLILEHAKEALPEYKKASWGKPRFVRIKLSENLETRNKDMFDELMGHISIARKPERYIEFKKINIKSIEPIGDLNKYNAEQTVKSKILSYPEADGWLPLKANAKDMVVLVNKKEGNVIQIVDLRPWSK